MPEDPRERHCKRKDSTGQSTLPDCKAFWDFRFKAESARDVAGIVLDRHSYRKVYSKMYFDNLSLYTLYSTTVAIEKSIIIYRQISEAPAKFRGCFDWNMSIPVPYITTATKNLQS